MIPRFVRLATPALVACSLAATQPALAQSAPVAQRHLVPHHHDATLATADGPGRQLQTVTLPAPSYQVHTDTQLANALQSATPGQVIHLASGSTFSHIDDYKHRSGWVTVSGAGDAVTPQIGGARMYGSQYLRFTNVEFTHWVYVGQDPVSHAPSENIQILNSEVNCGSTATFPTKIGLQVQGAAQNVTIVGDYVHDCTIGFASHAQDNPTDNPVIEHDLFQDFYGDAIDLGADNNTTIADNIIQNIRRTPGMVFHDDGIQFFGNTNNTLIQDNVLDNSLDQLIFVQDAVKGYWSGRQTNSNVTVDHNLIYGAGAVAVQFQGVLNGRFDDNTVWYAHDGAFLLRASGSTGTPSTLTTFNGNILQSYLQYGPPGSESNNMIGVTSSWTAKRLNDSDVVGASPSFIDSSSGNFALTPGSIGSGTASSTSTAIQTASATPTSTPTAGAGFNQSIVGANPQNINYGAPMFGTGS